MVAELVRRIEENRQANSDASSREPMADPGDIQEALARFEPLWEQLNTQEREHFIRALVTEVRYDGRTQTVTLGFHSEAIRELCSGNILQGQVNR
jgi:hypothetical protein